MASLVQFFIAKRDAAYTTRKQTPATEFWVIPSSDKSPKQWTADTMTIWLRTATRLVGVVPPHGFPWTLHSLRKKYCLRAKVMLPSPLAHLSTRPAPSVVGVARV